MMQRLAPLSVDRNPNQHTDAEVLSALTAPAGVRRFSFRYELLESTNVYVENLPNVVACHIEQNWLADIKRTAKMTIRETGRIDYLSDRIRPIIRTWLPPYGANDYVEHPQGVFLLVSPKRTADANGAVWRDVECYDALQVYSDDLVSNRYTVATAANVVSAVVTLLGSVPMVVTPSTKTLTTAKEWDPGTSKLKIINELLDSINYESLSFDEDGQAIVQPYRPPTERAEEFDYSVGGTGLIVPGAEQELDLFSIPNRWTLVVSEPDQDPIVATYTNTDPASPTSTVRRARTITDYRTEQDAVDLATLTAKAARLAFEASQVYEAIPFTTGMMPMHSGNDVYHLAYPALAVNAKYAEQSWSLDLTVGAKMTHRARRVVSI